MSAKVRVCVCRDLDFNGTVTGCVCWDVCAGMCVSATSTSAQLAHSMSSHLACHCRATSLSHATWPRSCPREQATSDGVVPLCHMCVCAAIGSGGTFAVAAARALMDNTTLDALTIGEAGRGDLRCSSAIPACMCGKKEAGGAIPLTGLARE